MSSAIVLCLIGGFAGILWQWRQTQTARQHALDEANACGVIELLMELHRDIGATLVVVTHDPTIAAYASDRLELARTPSMLEASHVG